MNIIMEERTMKQIIQSLFMVLLLVFAIVPTYTLAASDPVLGEDKQGMRAPTNGVDLAPPETRYADPATFWLTKGQTAQVSTGVSVTYLGTQGKNKESAVCTDDVKLCDDGKTYVSRNGKYNCAFDACPGEIQPPKPMSDAQACERFSMSYASTGISDTVAADGVAYPTKGSGVASKANENAYGDGTDDRTVVTKTSAVARVEQTVTGDVKNADGVFALVEPSAEDKTILGTTVYDRTVVDVNGLTAAKALTPKDKTRSEVLFNQVVVLAKNVGREDYLAFTIDEDKVADALVMLLRSKNLNLIGPYTPGKGTWEAEVQAFITYNKINVASFESDVRLAQKELLLAQINAYNSLLLLQNNQVDDAEKHYAEGMTHYEAFQKVLTRIEAEVYRWKALPRNDGTKDKTAGNEFCIVPGEVGYPIILYEKDEQQQRVLVGYNNGIADRAVKRVGDYVDAKEVTDKTKTRKTKAKNSKQEGSCIVEGDGAVPVGTRVSIDGVSMYCDALTKKMQDQKADGDEAENNYQCESNESRNGICVNSLNFLEKIWKTITGIFGFN